MTAAWPATPLRASHHRRHERERLSTLGGIAERISCPVLVCEAEIDHFNPGQARRLAAGLGDRPTLRPFTAAASAALHAHPGASVLLNGVVLDWLTEAVEHTQAYHSHDGYSDLRTVAGTQGISG